jgi:hypothetical protein
MYMGESMVKAVALAATLLLLSYAATARAALVSVNGNVAFYDNFEDEAIGSEPLPNDSPPGSTPGAWDGTTSYSHVHNATSQYLDPLQPDHDAITPGIQTTTDGPTAAYEGSQFLRLLRPGSGGATVGANFGSVATPGSGSTTISAKFAMFVPVSAGDLAAQFALSSTPDYFGSPAYIYVDDDGGIYYHNSVNFVQILKPDSTPMTYTQGVWQVWNLTYSLNAGAGNDTYTVTIDGVTSAPTTAVYNANGTFDTNSLKYLVFSDGANQSTFYVDATGPLPRSRRQ